MKRLISMLLAIAVVLGSVALLAGCGAPENDGAHIAIYLGAATYDFDPTDYYADDNAEQVMSLLFEPLFRINKKGKLVNAGAKSYEIDEEKRQIVIELDETYWSDDIRVKAADYVYAWCERILNPNNPNPAAALFYSIENALAAKSGSCTVADIGAKATDIYELTITYNEGADVDRLLRNLASVAASPVRQDMVDQAPTYWSKSVNTMVFNGPFKIKSLDLAMGELVLSRNMGYHQEIGVKDYDNNVIPGELVGFITANGEEVELTYSDIESKTVFFMGDATLQDRTANKDNAVKAANSSTYSYVFNTEHPLFKDERVRYALSIAIDRAAIAAQVGFGKAADGFISDDLGGAAEAYLSANAEMTKAQELINSVNLAGISKSFELTIENTELDNKIADLVIESWSALGFKVTKTYAEVVESTISGETYTDSGIQVLVKEASYGNRDFDVIAVDWQLYADDAFVGLCAFSTTMGGCGVDFTTATPRSNIAGWASSDYDYSMNNAYKLSGEERAAALAAAERTLCESAPIVPILFNESFAFVSEDLSGLYVDGNGNFNFTLVKQKNYEDYLEDEE